MGHGQETRQRLEAGQGLKPRLQFDVQGVQHQKDAQAVQPPVDARLGQLEIDGLAEQDHRMGHALPEPGRITDDTIDDTTSSIA